MSFAGGPAAWDSGSAKGGHAHDSGAGTLVTFAAREPRTGFISTAGNDR
jgi:hypothetical protein